MEIMIYGGNGNAKVDYRNPGPKCNWTSTGPQLIPTGQRDAFTGWRDDSSIVNIKRSPFHRNIHIDGDEGCKT